MSSLTLKQLRYFEALARHGHFGRAAEACAISQPALSQQIKELEEGLGTVLFERGARQVRLTGFGAVFSERVHDVLRAVDDLEDMARMAGSMPLARLRLGVIPTIAPYLLPRLLATLDRAYPGIDVHVRETITPRLIDELVGGRIDGAIVALPVSEPALTEVALFSEEMVLVRPADAVEMPVPRPNALREMRLLLLEEGHCFRDQALAYCNAHGTGGGDGFDGSSLSTLVQMVGAGLGVTLIPEMAVPVETRSAAVTVARFGPPAPERTVGMVWRRSTPLAPHLREVAEITRGAATGRGTA